MSEITLVKEWCDKEDKKQPTYSFTGFGTNWVCILYVDWLEEDIYSENSESKKLAKQDASKQLWKIIMDNKTQHYSLKEKTLMLIDGDQRMDCWTFLEDENNTFQNIKMTSVISPSSYAPNSPNQKVNIVRTKTTGKDSADALILIMLGKNLYNELRVDPARTILIGYKKILIVSADHILVQAAMDTDGVDWVSNVKDLKKYLEINSF
jgi:hypothetical protein